MVSSIWSQVSGIKFYIKYQIFNKILPSWNPCVSYLLTNQLLRVLEELSLLKKQSKVIRDNQLVAIYHLLSFNWLSSQAELFIFFMGKNVNICIKSIEDTFNQACENCLLIIELGKIVISGLVLKIFHIWIRVFTDESWLFEK